MEDSNQLKKRKKDELTNDEKEKVSPPKEIIPNKKSKEENSVEVEIKNSEEIKATKDQKENSTENSTEKPKKESPAKESRNIKKSNSEEFEFNGISSKIIKIGAMEYKADLIVPAELVTMPKFNFVGMMIGPAGYTQRQMESNTGCSITVRGKGSTRNIAPLDPDKPMFVQIKSDSPSKIETAAKIVAELLTDSAKRDVLRQQQQIIRNSQFTQNSYATPQLLINNTYSLNNNASAPRIPYNRTPFQNCFQQSPLGNNQFSLSMLIPRVREHIFEGTRNLEDIALNTGATLRLGERNENALEILIHGSNEAVTAARIKAQEVIENDPSETNLPVNDYIMVPNGVVGLIIGKSGETIKRIMSDTNCRIKVVPEYLTQPGETERKILLSGDQTQCANAKFVLNDLLTKYNNATASQVSISNPAASAILGGGYSNSSSTRCVVVSIPCGCIGILIGKGGEAIRGLGSRTHSKVQVVQTDENQLFPGGVIQNQDMRHVSIQGTDDAIQRAKNEIQSIINEHAHRHNYAPPKLNNENGNPLLGLTKEQYEKYIEQMRMCCNMGKKEVHEYYHNVMGQIGREPAQYAALVKQYIANAYAAANVYQQQQMAQQIQMVQQPQMATQSQMAQQPQMVQQSYYGQVPQQQNVMMQGGGDGRYPGGGVQQQMAGYNSNNNSSAVMGMGGQYYYSETNNGRMS